MINAKSTSNRISLVCVDAYLNACAFNKLHACSYLFRKRLNLSVWCGSFGWKLTSPLPATADVLPSVADY